CSRSSRIDRQAGARPGCGMSDPGGWRARSFLWDRRDRCRYPAWTAAPRRAHRPRRSKPKHAACLCPSMLCLSIQRSEREGISAHRSRFARAETRNTHAGTLQAIEANLAGAAGHGQLFGFALEERSQLGGIFQVEGPLCEARKARAIGCEVSAVHLVD